MGHGRGLCETDYGRPRLHQCFRQGQREDFRPHRVRIQEHSGCHLVDQGIQTHRRPLPDVLLPQLEEL